MDSELLNSYLDNIGELVIDEDKIVTYKFLSKTLGIHVNTAKQLLFTYLTRQKSESSPSISATYLLAGKLNDGSFKVTVVNKNELKTSYEKFAEITSEHIYSIQKGKALKNIQILCGIGKDIQNNKSSSVIKCSKSVIKPKNNNKKNVEVLAGNEIKIQTFDEKKDKLNKVSPKKSEELSEECFKKSPKKSKENERKSQETLKKNKGNIANFFENATQKTFLKSNNIEKITTDSVNNKKQAIESTSGSLTVSAPNLLPDPKNQNEEKPNSIRNEKKNLNKKKSENKRKRIQLFSDSEDSSNSDKDESIVENEPTEISLPAAILEDEKEEEIEVKTHNKRKRRKIVDKTIMNKDGYLETKKEVIFETDSDIDRDEEEEDLTKKGGNEKKKTKLNEVAEKKISTKNAAKKQSSLLTFFKKN